MNGFTTIIDLGTERADYAGGGLKKAIANDVIPGPRMLVFTLAINITGHNPILERDYAWELKMPNGLKEITGADEGRKAVREQIAYSANRIKIYADRGYQKLPNGEYRSTTNFTKRKQKPLQMRLSIADENCQRMQYAGWYYLFH